MKLSPSGAMATVGAVLVADPIMVAHLPRGIDGGKDAHPRLSRANGWPSRHSQYPICPNSNL